jgi:uracil-DNA glycosylase
VHTRTGRGTPIQYDQIRLRPEEQSMELARQLKAHLEALRSAGVEFVPVGEPLVFAPAQLETRGANIPASFEPLAEPVTGGTDTPRTLEPDSRRHELTILAQTITSCNRCPELFSTRTQTVFGVGPVDPEICFVGEAPGAEEDAKGEPFVGRAGQLLNKIIAACGFAREEVYICNTIKCRPPNNRTPSPTERDSCRDYFDRQIALVRPKYIVCLGATAAQNVLGTTVGIGKLRGSMHRFGDIPVLCTFHPAYLLRDETKKKECWDDMKFLLKLMGRPIPGAK